MSQINNSSNNAAFLGSNAPTLPSPLSDKGTVGSLAAQGKAASSSAAAASATVATPLILDTGIQGSASLAGVTAGFSLAAADILPMPSEISSEKMQQGLSEVATDYDHLATLANTFAGQVHAAVVALGGGRGRVAGEHHGEGSAAGNAKASASAAPASSSSSKSTSPTGVTTSVMTSEQATAGGGVTTDTTTTVSSSGSSTTTSPYSSTSGGFSYIDILADIAFLMNAQNQTMASQLKAQMNTSSQQLSSSISAANKMSDSATAGMIGASCMLAVSVGTAGAGVKGQASAAEEGSAAELQAVQRQNTSVHTSSDSAMEHTQIAMDHPNDTNSIATAKRANSSLRETSKNPSVDKEVQQHAKDTADHLDAAANAASYQKGGVNAGKDFIDINEDNKAMEPKEAADYHMRKAQKSQGKLEAATKKITISSNKNSEAYNRAYGNKVQSLMVYQGLGTAMGNMANQAGQFQASLDQAASKKQDAQATYEGTQNQMMAQGVSQTTDLANSLRSTAQSIAQDMQSTSRLGA